MKLTLMRDNGETTTMRTLDINTQIETMIHFYLYNAVISGHLYTIDCFTKSGSRDNFGQFLDVVQFAVR